MSPRRDEQRLLDIIERATLVGRALAGQTFDSWQADDVLVSAVLYDLVVIGEAAAAVSDDLRQRHPEIPWTELVGFRNVLIHTYAHVRRDIVWPAATTDVPALRARLVAILRAEFPLAATALDDHEGEESL